MYSHVAFDNLYIYIQPPPLIANVYVYSSLHLLDLCDFAVCLKGSCQTPSLSSTRPLEVAGSSDDCALVRSSVNSQRLLF